MIAMALAFHAGPVAGRMRGGLVEEEQLGVVTRRNQGPPPSLELQHADDPAPADEGAANATGVVVQAPAVTHQGAARRSGDQLAERRDAILPWHPRYPRCVASRYRSACSAAMQPVPAAVTAWRQVKSATSPAANTPGTDVSVAPGATFTYSLGSSSSWPRKSAVLGRGPIATNRPSIGCRETSPVLRWRSVASVSLPAVGSTSDSTARSQRKLIL